MINLSAFQGSIVKLNIKFSVRWVNIEELKNFNFAPADIYFVEKLMENKWRKQANKFCMEVTRRYAY